LAQELDLSRRLLGTSAICHSKPGDDDISVELDVGGLIRRLLLFDTYILYTVRLKEIPEMVRHFGYQGTLALLKSGALEIRCECAQWMEGAYTTPVCPPLTYQFHVIEAHNREQYLIDNLANVHRTTLNSRELTMLREAVVGAVRRTDNLAMFRSDVAPAFAGDVLHNAELLKSVVRFLLARDRGISDVEDFSLGFQKVGEDRYEATTDLPRRSNLSVGVVHETLKTALLGVGGVNLRVGEMKAHTALSGFTPEELPFFRCKLDQLIDAYASNRQEQRFQRVVSIAGFGDFVSNADINIEKVLEIRNEPEAIEFRGWLSGIDKYDDSEIQQRISALNVKLGIAAQRTSGKVIRLLTTTAAGFLPHVGIPLGIALSGLDQFLWDRFARKSGPAAFVHELYPSVFERN
jgi:hypothetical protein